MTTAARLLLTCLVAAAAVLHPTGDASAAQRTVTYSVSSRGDVVGDPGHLAAVARETLNDPRGWSLGGTVAFQQVASGGDFTLILASPSAVAAASSGCSAEWSCRVGRNVYINDNRWRFASAAWPHGLPQYQRYVIVHEVGHWVGVPHTGCKAPGAIAWAMQQQSIDLEGCRANVWPVIAERELASSRLGVPVNWSAIEGKYRAMGQAAGPLGVATTWEEYTHDGVGHYQHFAGSGGASIFWHPSTGAYEVHGAVRDRWAQLSWERGPLGYPSTGQLPTDDRRGRYVHFAGSGGGSIFWSPETGANEVYGAVRDAYARTGFERGPLGYPSTGQWPTTDGRGRYVHFAGSGGGSIFWSPETGAHELYGAVRDTYARTGFERGPLGYPSTGQWPTTDGRGRYVHFAGSGGSSIFWSPETGAHEVHGPIRAQWAQLNWERGDLGYPVSGMRAVDGGTRVDFQGGSITLDAVSGQTQVVRN